jgi:hypothetical protein
MNGGLTRPPFSFAKMENCSTPTDESFLQRQKGLVLGKIQANIPIMAAI